MYDFTHFEYKTNKQSKKPTQMPTINWWLPKGKGYEGESEMGKASQIYNTWKLDFLWETTRVC